MGVREGGGVTARQKFHAEIDNLWSQIFLQ